MPILPYKGVMPTIAEDVFIAPGAMIIGNVTIHEGASIWYNAVVRGDTAPIVVGRRTNIQDNCTLHVDADAPLTIGDECTVGHGAVVHGATVGDHVHLAMRAVILSHAQVGSTIIHFSYTSLPHNPCNVTTSTQHPHHSSLTDQRSSPQHPSIPQPK